MQTGMEAVPGDLPGGWVGSGDNLQLAACRTAAGGSRTFARDRGRYTNPRGRRHRIRLRDLAGFGQHKRSGRRQDRACCPPPHRPLLRTTAHRAGNRTDFGFGEAQATCIVGCRATLVAKRGRLKERVTRILAASSGPDARNALPVTTLRIPARALQRLGRKWTAEWRLGVAIAPLTRHSTDRSNLSRRLHRSERTLQFWGSAWGATAVCVVCCAVLGHSQPALAS
jgi:hypothetical protein